MVVVGVGVGDGVIRGMVASFLHGCSGSKASGRNVVDLRMEGGQVVVVIIIVVVVVAGVAGMSSDGNNRLVPSRLLDGFAVVVVVVVVVVVFGLLEEDGSINGRGLWLLLMSVSASLQMAACNTLINSRVSSEHSRRTKSHILTDGLLILEVVVGRLILNADKEL